jgi:hypothetical protein
MNDDEAEWHRTFATRLFNSTWTLIEKPDRSADLEIEMLLAAVTSRWHWGQVGDVEQVAAGDWQVAHVASLLGQSELALRFAERHLQTAIAQGWDGWRLASAHEGMARALAAAGDGEGRDHHVAEARRALEREGDAEDKEIIEAQIDSVPGG